MVKWQLTEAQISLRRLSLKRLRGEVSVKLADANHEMGDVSGNLWAFMMIATKSVTGKRQSRRSNEFSP